MKAKKSVYKAKSKKLTITSKRARPISSYDEDFYQWTTSQAAILRKGDFKQLDIDHLIEEIESLGRSEKRAIKNHLANLLLHLLKIQYQPGRRTKSCDLSVKNSQHEVQLLLKENPSLKPYMPHILKEAYFTGRLEAISQTGLDDSLFPEDCPWTVKELLSK